MVSVPAVVFALMTAPRKLQSLAAAVHAEAAVTSSNRSTVKVAVGALGVAGSPAGTLYKSTGETGSFFDWGLPVGSAVALATRVGANERLSASHRAAADKD